MPVTILSRSSLAFTSAFLILIARTSDAVILSEGWTSARAMGMGNAYSAVVSNSDALFYNPAGLAKNKGLSWEIIDLHVGADGVNTYQTFQNLNSSGSYVSALHQFFGQSVWLGIEGKTSLN